MQPLCRVELDGPHSNLFETGIVPEDKFEAEKVRKNAPHCWISEEQKLYKCSYSGPYLLCVYLEVVEPLLDKLHESICGSHTGGRFLAHKALT